MSEKTPERKAKEAANMRAWRAANRERAREIDRRGKEKNAEAVKATKKRCYAKHRDQNLAYAASYREANLEQIKERCAGKYSEWSARYREKNTEACRLRSAAWKAANPEQRKATQAIYLQNNLARHCVHQNNRRARKAAVGGRLSIGLSEKLFALQKGKCSCCGSKLGNDYHLDHIVPLALGGPNTDSNIQLLTAKCNKRKGAKHPVAYMQTRGLLL